MPHEKINHPRRNINDDVTIPDPSPDGNHTPPQPGEILNTEKVPKDQLVVSWNGIGWVQVSVYPEGWSSTGDAEHVELKPQELDLLIKTLRRAKRQAYGQGNRHSGFEDGPELTSRPLFKQKQYLDGG